MATYKVTYEAEGQRHTVIVKAWNRSSARIKGKQMALALGYSSVLVLAIKELE